MSEYGNNRPAVTIAPNEYEMKRGVDMQLQFNTSVSHAIIDHAHKIDALHAQLMNLTAFMDWVAHTHGDVFQQYHAIKDLERVSNE